MGVVARAKKANELLVIDRDLGLPRTVEWFKTNELPELAKAVEFCDELKQKPVVAVVKPNMPRKLNIALAKLVKQPNVVVAFVQMRDEHENLLKEMAAQLPFPIPPFRVFACPRDKLGSKYRSLDALQRIARELVKENSMLRHLSDKWCFWDSKSGDSAKRGLKIWLIADVHLGELRGSREPSQEGDILYYGEHHLGWLSQKAQRLPLAQYPDIVMLLGDIFDRGAYYKSEVLKEFFQVLHAGMKKAKVTTFGITGEHDCFKPSKSKIFYTNPFKKWATSFQNFGLVTVHSGRIRGRPKNLSPKVVSQRVGLSVCNAVGQGVTINHLCKSWKKGVDEEFTTEALGILRYQKNQGIPLRIVLLSSFNPMERKPLYVDIKGGTLSDSARTEAKRLLRKYLRDEDGKVVLNILCMHHALTPEDMRLSENTLAYMVRGIGDFTESLTLMQTEGINNVVLLHGHTHVFHVSTKKYSNTIHIGVPPLGSKYPRDPHGFAVLSLIKTITGQYALCVAMYTIRWTGDSNVYGSVLLPLELVILEIVVDDQGSISKICGEPLRFRANFSLHGHIPYIDDFEIERDEYEKQEDDSESA